ncbi:MAG: hypothetical protein IRZ21_06545 [Thermoleophilaceae bacterium]|nr:hypothetical protein [Thermoleophilaceae bacterium]
MGRRSRKRGAAGGAPGGAREVSAVGSTRAERDAARRARAQALAREPARPHRVRARPATRPKPPAPWGSFPLTELVVLLAIVLLVTGVIVWGDRGRTMVVAALALGSLGGLEVSIREHYAGYRSHTSLLAGAAGVAVTLLVAVGFRQAPLGVAVGAGAAVFALCWWLFRRAFRKASGGVAFR